MAHVRSNIIYFHFTYLQDFMKWIVKLCRDLQFPHFSKFAISQIPRCPNKTFEMGNNFPPNKPIMLCKTGEKENLAEMFVAG